MRANSGEWPAKVPDAAVTRSLEALVAGHDGAQLVELFVRLGNVVSAGVKLPVAELVGGVPGHGWVTLEVYCPYCEVVRELTELEVLDHAYRRASAVAHDPSAGRLIFDRCELGGFEGLHFLMGCCGRPVALPAGVRAGDSL